MAISYVGIASAQTTSATLPSFQVGDVAIVLTFNNAAATAPTRPSGWSPVNATWPSGTNSTEARGWNAGYRVLQAGDTSTGTWTNATDIVVAVYRGVDKNSPIDINPSSEDYIWNLQANIGTAGVPYATGPITGYGTNILYVSLSANSSDTSLAAHSAGGSWTNRSSGTTNGRVGVWDTTSSWAQGSPWTASGSPDIIYLKIALRPENQTTYPMISDTDTTSGTVTSNSSSWTLTYPTNIAAGDLLLGMAAVDGSTAGGGFPNADGWNNAISARVACALYVAGKIATGSETGTFTFSSGTSEQGSWVIYRIPAGTWYGSGLWPNYSSTLMDAAQQDGNGTAAYAAYASSSNPDSPSLNPNNWDVENTLWLAVMSADTSRTVSAYPSSPDTFTNTGSLVSGGSNGATLAWGRLEKNASSVDPGTFTISNSDDWVAATIAIRSRQYFSRVAQAQAQIGGAVAYRGYAQSQAQVKSFNIKGYAQSKALIYSTPQYSEVYDSFNRSVATGWGTSDNAGDWLNYVEDGWSVTSNAGQFDFQSSFDYNMHLIKMVPPTKWKISFEYALLNALPDASVQIWFHDAGPSAITGFSPIGKIAGVSIQSNKAIWLTTGYHGQGSSYASGATYGSLGDVWVYEAYVWWESGNVKVDARTWNKNTPETTYSYLGSRAATEDSLPGHLLYQAWGSFSTNTYIQIDNLNISKWMAKPVAQAQGQIKQTVRVYAQSTAQIKLVNSGYAQSLAHIKSLNIQGYGQSQATIKTIAIKVYAQASGWIKTTYLMFGQSQAQINQTYQGYAQAQLYVKNSYLGFAQAEAKIIPSVAPTGHSQALAQIGTTTALYSRIDEASINDNDYIVSPVASTYAEVALDPLPTPDFLIDHFIRVRVSGLNNPALSVVLYQDTTIIASFDIPDVITTEFITFTLALNSSQIALITDYSNLHLRFIADGRVIISWAEFQTPFGSGTKIRRVYAQAQATILAAYVTYSGFGQAQAVISRTEQSYAQAQGYIIVRNINAYAQAMAHIIRTEQGYAQAQAWVKVYGYVYAQAQAQIKQAYWSYAQAQAWIEVYGYGYAQAQAQIKTTYAVFAQAQAYIKITELEGFAQAQAIIRTTYCSYAQAQAYIKVTELEGFAQAQAQIRTTYFAYAQTQAQIRQTYRAYAQAQAWIEQTYTGFAQAQAQIKQSYFVYAQAQAQIKQTYQAYAQAQTWIRIIQLAYAQAQAIIEVATSVFAQAQALIKTTSNAYAQASVWMEGMLVAYAQAQATIKTSYFVYAQAQAQIVISISVHAQAQAHIKASTLVYAQAQAQIKTTYLVYAQAQATIINAYLAYAQAQAQIKQSYQSYAQAQASIKSTYSVFAQAQAYIRLELYVFAQAQAQIVQTYQGYAQAQATILLVQVAWAQAEATIEVATSVHAQAQAQILTTYNAYAQASVWVEGAFIQVAQAQAQIRTTYLVYAQAMAQIRQTYFGWSQAQGYIKLVDQLAYAQAQAQIKQTYQAYAQAQATIILIQYAYAQAQAVIEQTYLGYAQAQATISTTVYACAQAAGWIAGSMIQLAQAQATIAASPMQPAQAMAYVYIPQFSRPISDNSNSGWERTVI